ncbi:MAG: hypothetical protein GY750_19640 [Lentisphaerae bacterium]|nr:hypothetical protein [Lentisphaerota bacterium]MCP4103611.1 hypothetical protein [Lentisphaerota bacterium]
MFYEAALNIPMGYGQHYKKGTLNLGANYTANGICHGLALTWLKNISTHFYNYKSDDVFTPIALPRGSEAASVHCRMNFAFNTRADAHRKVDQEAYATSVRTTDPDDYYTDDNCGFLAAYKAYGFSEAEYKGSFSPVALVSMITGLVEEDIFGDYFKEQQRMKKMKENIQAFLLVNGGHAMGLGVTGTKVGFMDPSYGLYDFTLREVTGRRSRLANTLKLRVQSFDVKSFTVVALKYFN